MKNNLPVILLKGLILLPNNEIRLEFENEESKSIIEVSELFHDKKLLVVSNNDPLEEVPRQEDLPRIGVVAKISHKLELPNGNTRVVLTGLYRTQVCEYLNLNHVSEILEAIVLELPIDSISQKEEEILTRKLYRELEEYIKSIPYVSNSVLGTVKNCSDLAQMTDLIVPHLPIRFTRLNAYLLEVRPKVRATMLLEDIYQEQRAFDIEKELDNKVKEGLDTNQKDYILREKLRLIQEELGDSDEIDHQLAEKIENFHAPEKIKKRLQQEYQRYMKMQPMAPEANVIRTYMDWLLALPWQEQTKDNAILTDVAKKLDATHAGLEKVKTRIIEYLAVKQMTNQLNGPIICLVGPPGVGKTTLAETIAQAMNRNFVKISVGGVSDEAEIMGHRRTYLGAGPGRIIQSMKKATSNNPVFLIDEVDKMAKGYHGDPANSLLEVLDPTQNCHFSDHYIEEEFDLSHVMFLLTANDMNDIPDPLYDRLEVIELSGYTEQEKLDIALHHLIPSVCTAHGMKKERILFEEEALLKIIRDYTREAGVRELKRQIETVVRKIVTEVVKRRKYQKEYRITTKQVATYLGREKFSVIDSSSRSVGVVNGLAYTYYGGDTLAIEVNYYRGNGNLVLTGCLGEVMKESAIIALSYIKANYEYLGVDYQKLVENDIHIHVPEGAIKKDGPSAGIALTTALISALKHQLVATNIAMTGEITLRGKILPIGGLKEKSIGAVRSGIKEVIIPYENRNDLADVPKEIRKQLTYHMVKNYKEVLPYVFPKEKQRKDNVHEKQLAFEIIDMN